MIHNLDLLGARVSKPLKDIKQSSQPLFAKKPPPPPSTDDSALSRYEPAVKLMLEDHTRGILDQTTFPFTKPHLDAAEGLMGQENMSQASLRSAKPTWARTRPTSLEPRQRVIVFMAGGATYAESRACHEISKVTSKDVFLATSHMLTPSLFLRQVGDLSVDKRQLNLPAEKPKAKAPAHLFEPEGQPQSQASSVPTKVQPPPTSAMASMQLTSREWDVSRPSNGTASGHILPANLPQVQSASDGKSSRKDKSQETDRKKKHHFFGSKK